MLLLQAQNATDPTAYLFASDKIYTVLTVVLIILIGFITYLLLTNRRISRLEEELKTRKKQQGHS